MKVPRIRIAWVMVAVAVAALNFGAIRAWSQLRIGHGLGPKGRIVSYINNTVDELVIGALPMANVLVIGLLLGQRHSASRPFLLGFETFGVAALAFFVVLAYFYTEEVVQPYVLWFLRLRSLQRIVANFSPVFRIPIFYSIAALLVGLPQLVFALVGGLLSHRFRITITLR